jgi:hypothetical protein
MADTTKSTFQSRATYQRDVLPEHLESIRSLADIESSRATQIIDNIFKHFPAAFSQGEPHFYHGRRESSRLPDAVESADQPSADWLGWTFYHKFYSTVQVSRGTTGKGSILTIEEFISEITASHPDDDRNSFNFLVGNIGDGKTAFINWLITTQFTETWNDSNFWFLRLNPDFSTFIEHEDYEERRRHFFTNFRRRLQFVFGEIEANAEDVGKPFASQQIGHIKDLLRAAETTSSIEDLSSHLKDVIASVSTMLRRKFLLIIDNLDAFFHDHDRYLFIDDKGTGEDESVKFISEILIQFFHVTSPLGRFGGDLLVVVRPDSYQLMKAKRHLFRGFEACFREDRNAYSVSKPSWKGVIRQRLFLLNTIADTLAKEPLNDSVCRHISQLLEDLDVHSEAEKESEHEIYGLLRDISNQGIRSVVDFFSMYAWLPDNSDVRTNLTRRYIDHQPVGMIAYILNNKMMFSQAESRFPNIFMVNGPAFGDQDVIRKRSKGRFSTAHKHTYWLKLLLLRLLHHLTYRSPEAITIQRIVEALCGSQDDSLSGFYAQNIVRIVMGSFAQSHQTSLISVGRKVSPDGAKLLLTGEIKLTERGKFLNERLVFSFPYLQLVIDDNYLLLPRMCKDFFAYDKVSNYGYLVMRKNEYIEHADRMLRRKIPQVAKFVALLRVSYDLERDSHSGAFDAVEAYGVPPVDMRAVEFEFLKELGAISSKKTGLFRRYPELSPDNVHEQMRRHIQRLRRDLPCLYSS